MSYNIEQEIRHLNTQISKHALSSMQTKDEEVRKRQDTILEQLREAREQLVKGKQFNQ